MRSFLRSRLLEAALVLVGLGAIVSGVGLLRHQNSSPKAALAAPSIGQFSINALGQTAAVPVAGSAGVSVWIEGTWSGTLQFQASYDGGTTWLRTMMYPVNNDKNISTVPPSTSSTYTISASTGSWVTDINGAALFQVTATAWTSGTANIWINPSAPWQSHRNYGLWLFNSGTRSTGTNTTAVMENRWSRGVVLFVNVTATTGSAGITSVVVNGVDPLTGNAGALFTDSTAITSNGTVAIMFYPGIGSATHASGAAVLPNLWSVSVTIGAASTVTYSLSASLID